MEENIEDNIRRKKDKKSNKHFDILINGKKIKILNYQIRDIQTPLGNEKVIEFISQQKFDKADTGLVKIRIETVIEKVEILGEWKFGWNGPGNHGMAYRIKEINQSLNL